MQPTDKPTDKPTTLPANATLDQRLELAQRTLKEHKLEDLAQAVSQARMKIPADPAAPVKNDDDDDEETRQSRNGEKAKTAAPTKR